VNEAKNGCGFNKKEKDPVRKTGEIKGGSFANALSGGTTGVGGGGGGGHLRESNRQ